MMIVLRKHTVSDTNGAIQQDCSMSSSLRGHGHLMPKGFQYVLGCGTERPTMTMMTGGDYIHTGMQAQRWTAWASSAHPGRRPSVEPIPAACRVARAACAEGHPLLRRARTPAARCAAASFKRPIAGWEEGVTVRAETRRWRNRVACVGPPVLGQRRCPGGRGGDRGRQQRSTAAAAAQCLGCPHRAGGHPPSATPRPPIVAHPPPAPWVAVSTGR